VNTKLNGVTITVWEANTLQPQYKDLFAAFEKKTGAKIDEVVFPDPFESNLLTKWATGERPDVLIFQGAAIWLNKLQAEKNLVDLSSLPGVALEKFGLADAAGAENGKTYGLNIEYPTLYGLWYNKKVMSDLKTDLPQGFDDLAKTCDAAKAAGVSLTYEAGGDKWPLQIMPFLLWAGEKDATFAEKLNTNKAEWTDPKITTAFSQYLKLRDQGCFNSDYKVGTYTGEQTALTTGSTAMVAQGSFMIPDLLKQLGQKKLDETVGFAPFSAGGPLVQWQPNFAFYLPKNKDSVKLNAAASLLNFASGPAYQDFINTAGTPSALEGFETPSTVPQAIQDADAAFAKQSVGNFQTYMKADYGDFPTIMSQILVGQITPEEAGKQMQATWVKTAKVAGLAGF